MRKIDDKLSREIAMIFLKAVGVAEVKEILRDHESLFGDPKNWAPYGGSSKNWDRVGVQTSEPVGALAELIINSIDAILMRKAIEKGLKMDSAGAPTSMIRAVEQFFPVTEGKIARLSPVQRTNLAEKSVLIGVKRVKKRHAYPTYTIADFGEGQDPACFPNTLLSLSEKNKEGIPFVQGRFNMGSTGSITFCTRAEIREGLYKFILSKRTVGDKTDLWGWTLIRVRKAAQGEKLPVVEYFCPAGLIPCFAHDSISIFERDDIGIVDGGTIVKLYEYDIGPGARAVDIGLYDALTTSLLECALPIRLYDFDAELREGRLRAEGISARTFSGMKVILDSEEESGSGAEFSLQVSDDSANPDLGRIKIHATGVRKFKDHMKNYPYRVFYTINGQAQAKERKSFLRRAKLDDLANHLVVEVDCNSMDNTAKSAIFKPDRERKSKNRFARELEDIVVTALREDADLRQYAAEIRRRRATEKIEEDEQSKNFLQELIRYSPEIKELLGLGEIASGTRQVPRGEKIYEGKQFPTKLTPKNLRDNVKELPINSYRIIECDTDAANDYLSRVNEPGDFFCSLTGVELPHRVKLRNGILRIRIHPPKNAEVGQTIDCRFGFRDVNRAEPLDFGAEIHITAEEKKTTSPPGTPRDTKEDEQPTYQFPDIRWVRQDEWDEHDFNEESGAHVSSHEDESGQSGVTIYVNADNKWLVAMTAKESDDAKRELIFHMFRFGVGILSLSIYKRANARKEGESDPDEILRVASSAISAHVVTLIRQLGGTPR